MVLQNSFYYENLGLQKEVSLKGVESKYVFIFSVINITSFNQPS